MSDPDREAKLAACKAHIARCNAEIERLEHELLLCRDAEADLELTDPYHREQLEKSGLQATVSGYPGAWFGHVSRDPEHWFVAHHLYVRKVTP